MADGRYSADDFRQLGGRDRLKGSRSALQPCSREERPQTTPNPGPASLQRRRGHTPCERLVFYASVIGVCQIALTPLRRVEPPRLVAVEKEVRAGPAATSSLPVPNGSCHGLRSRSTSNPT